MWIACGIGLVSSGVLLIGSGRSVTRSAVGWATATGVTIAAYTVIDAQGVRAAPSAQSYIAWIFLMLGGGLAWPSPYGADRASCWRPARNGAPACLPARCPS